MTELTCYAIVCYFVILCQLEFITQYPLTLLTSYTMSCSAPVHKAILYYIPVILFLVLRPKYRNVTIFIPVALFVSQALNEGMSSFCDIPVTLFADERLKCEKKLVSSLGTLVQNEKKKKSAHSGLCCCVPWYMLLCPLILCSCVPWYSVLVFLDSLLLCPLILCSCVPWYSVVVSLNTLLLCSFILCSCVPWYSVVVSLNTLLLCPLILCCCVPWYSVVVSLDTL